jgi:hypothetical protein
MYSEFSQTKIQSKKKDSESKRKKKHIDPTPFNGGVEEEKQEREGY